MKKNQLLKKKSTVTKGVHITSCLRFKPDRTTLASNNQPLHRNMHIGKRETRVLQHQLCQLRQGLVVEELEVPI